MKRSTAALMALAIAAGTTLGLAAICGGGAVSAGTSALYFRVESRK